jgi:hypothetical protein
MIAGPSHVIPAVTPPPLYCAHNDIHQSNIMQPIQHEAVSNARQERMKHMRSCFIQLANNGVAIGHVA